MDWSIDSYIDPDSRPKDVILLENFELKKENRRMAAMIVSLKKKRPALRFDSEAAKTALTRPFAVKVMYIDKYSQNLTRIQMSAKSCTKA